MIVQGEHGYVSPGWYPPSPRDVPTWNFTVAHCHGVPELLDEEENLAVLTRTGRPLRARAARAAPTRPRLRR